MPYITGQGEEGSADLTVGASWPERSPGAAAVVQGAEAQALPSPQRAGRAPAPRHPPALRRHSAQLEGKGRG